MSEEGAAEPIVPKIEAVDGDLDEKEANDAEGIDLDRVHLQNLPHYLGFKQFKKILEKNLGSIKAKKVRQMSQDAYISFETPEDAQQAIKILDGLEVKKSVLCAKLALTEVRKFQPSPEGKEGEGKDGEVKPVVRKTARESVTPLADIPYEEQLQRKDKDCFKLADRLVQQFHKANVQMAKGTKAATVLRKIKPSPKIRQYRNKCEFTVGKTLDGEVCVGFVGGRFSKNQHYVIPLDDVDNITDHCKQVVKEFEKFVTDSGLPPFDEFRRSGVWKMLTVREFSGDVMLIVTIFPLADSEQEKQLKETFASQFCNFSTFEERGFRVTSIYWQSQANSSDPISYEHIAGAPYIYETVMDCRFRVSPSAFFQTNSQAASVLYSTIGEACGFSEPLLSVEDETVEDEAVPAEKKAKTEEQAKPMTVLLDICCGTGTIGQCLMKKYGRGDEICCVGVEMIASAVEDAKQNAEDNQISSVKYIAGKAEDVFRSLRYYLPSNVSFDQSEVVGVLDPPRAGMHERVILGCREISKMRKLVFVSCDPAAAMKNIVDLCRPESKKFYGQPFSLESIQPVDMFPQTSHFEWVVALVR